MDRVLKRVGLSKRTDLGDDVHVTNLGENVKLRRRRRSKSRRRGDDSKKSRGIFNIDWESVKECKSCKSKAITKRFCSKKTDNELYRSNSFKFERFIRGNDDVSTLGKNVLIEYRGFSNEVISLCEDYSLPVDHLNKKRPNSIAVPTFISNLSDWNVVSSPNEDRVEVLDTYSSPRDSQQHLTQEDNDHKCFTSPDKEYSQPYTTDESSNPTSDEEFGYHCSVPNRPNPLDLNSPDSINEGVIAATSVLDTLSPTRTEISVSKRHPSPYYYGDLFKYKTTECGQPQVKKSNKKNQSLRQEKHERKKQNSRQHSVNKKSKTNRKYSRCTADNCTEPKDRKEGSLKTKLGTKPSPNVVSDSTDDALDNNQMPPNRVCNDGLDEMTRQRHVYETAFDCRISKSDDDLDEIDKVSNHPILVQINSTWNTQTGSNPSIDNNTLGRKERKEKPSQPHGDNNVLLNLSQELQKMQLASEDHTSSSGALPLRGYTPSPPSTAPLPAKFPGKELLMNSIRSAPNLPSKARLKDLRLPVKSLRGRSPATTSGSAFEIEFGGSNTNKMISEFKGRPGSSREQTSQGNERITEIKSRPKRDLLLIANRTKDSMVRRIRHKYSSTESMTTSSSGGSMESIKSSTSEGNRSTSSSESRHSASLSSHSSDSGGNRPQGYTTPQTNFLSQQTNNKLHILSPISDKSSQEPISETSDNNRNNNSQKCSPEVAEPSVSTDVKVKRRFPQNKNLLNLGLHDRPEIQGSDSGISIQSREGVKSRFGFTGTDLSAPPSQQDFSDLPFDMPKLRRRRIVPETACTSGSATSVDLRDLPFDMPKLRRRMRLQGSNLEDSVSQASSSQSVVEVDRAVCRPKLTLNLGNIGVSRQRVGLGLTLSGIGLNVSNDGASTSQSGNFGYNSSEPIDVNLPLEKQGWFHGSITRVEAENVLRVLREGSFLVRNSESIKNDYSLSLKSARGFMHMRIQKNAADGGFILGQFSKPFTTIPEMIKHFSVNRLPIRGAEHMCLLQPVIAQLL